MENRRKEKGEEKIEEETQSVEEREVVKDEQQMLYVYTLLIIKESFMKNLDFHLSKSTKISKLIAHLANKWIDYNL